MRSRFLALTAVSLLLAGCPNDKPLVTNFDVGGTVSGLVGAGLVLQNNLSDTVEVNQNGAFAFPTKLSKWTNYEVTVQQQPTMPAQTCTVENGAGTVTGEITDIKVSCSTATYAVGGPVTGLTGAGLVLQSDSGDELPVAANATRYAFHFASGAQYSLSIKTQPIKPSQTCALSNAVGTVGDQDINSIPLTCTTDSFLVGGAVVGLVGSGLVVESGGGEEVTVEKSATRYSFELESGVSYAIKVKTQPSSPQQTCVVDSANGVVDNARIENATITCTTDAFAVGGPIAGLAGSGLVLTNNGGSDLLVGSGDTTYAFVLQNGSAYDIQVKTQPTSPRQTCVVSNGTGTVGSANVANVAVTCVTDAYSVGGPITGLVGAGLVLQNNGKDDLAVPANTSAYSFLVPSGTDYLVTVKAQPTNPSQTCTVSNPSGSVAGAPVTNASITCITNAYTVGGTIAGLLGTGLVLQNNLSGDQAIAKGATGYSFKNVPSGTNYSITIKSQPTAPEQTCVVAKPTGPVVASNVTDANITCTTRTFSVGGPVAGLTGSGLVLQDGYGHEVPVASGASGYHFTLESGATYSIAVKTQPSSPQQTCVVVNGFGTVLKADITNISVDCGTNKFSVGGAITGLKGSGLILQNGAGNEITLASSATSYQFLVASGAGYTITVKQQPTDPSQTCVVSNGTGTVATANVTTATVACSTNTYSVGGTISGYTGSGLVLQNNGAGDKIIPAGATAYSFAVASGDTYLVSVKTDPTSPAQTCVVSSPTGKVGGAAVGNVNISCGTNAFSVGGSISGLEGTGLILQNGAGNEQPIAANAASYSFLVSSGAGYNITVKTHPSGPSQNCTVASPSGTVSGADVTNVNITCTTKSFTVGGTISGYTGTGLVLQNKGGSNQTIAKGASSYTFTVVSGDTYAISVLTQPASPSQTCSIANDSGTMSGANIGNATITCAINKYDVGGAITGLSGTGLILKENLGGTTQSIDPAAKSYAFSLASGASYSISVQTQPISPSQTCSVASPGGTVAGINITTAAVDCTTNLYTLGGTVSGLVGPSMVTLKNGSDTITSANGTFTFPTKVLSGSTYTVTAVAPPNHACTVTGGSDTMTTGNVSNVSVTCAWNTVILLAGTAGTTGHIAAAFQDNASGGAWTTPTNLAGATNSGTALAITGNGVGLGLVRHASSDSQNDRIKYTTWDGATWTQLADVGATVTTRSQPSIGTAAGQAGALAVFHGNDYSHYLLTWTLGWAFGNSVGTTFGPNPAFIQMRGADATVGFIAGVNQPYAIDRTAGAWGTPANIAPEGASFDPILHPVVVKPASGPDLMIIWHAPAPACPGVDCGKGFPLRFATRTAGTWSAARDVQYTWTKEPFAAAALPNGSVIVAVHRSDPGVDRLWTSLYNPATTTWTNPRDTGWTLIGGPAITRGMGAAVAEVAFVGVTDYKAYHCRILDSSGTCPSAFPVGSGVNFVSIATVP
ncbi:MAG TPA: hypothetical protein VGK67_03755 [Myxococcales bacterium]|jgi:hypothetical protein